MRDKKSRRPSVGAMNDSIQPTLIAGDSFSAAPPEWPDAWASCWPNAINVAERSISNWDIMKLLDELPLQPAVINFSHPHRFPRKYRYTLTEEERDRYRGSDKAPKWAGAAHRLNCQVVDRIIERWKDHALFWTPFPGYDRWSEVYWHFSREIHWQYYTTKGILKYQSAPEVANHMSLRGVKEWQKIVNSLWATKVKNSVALRAKLQTMPTAER